MDWTQALTIIGTIAAINIALFGIIATLVVWSINKLDSDIKGIGGRMDGHARRIDQLYTMFVDLLKERKS